MAPDMPHPHLHQQHGGLDVHVQYFVNGFGWGLQQRPRSWINSGVRHKYVNAAIELQQQ